MAGIPGISPFSTSALSGALGGSSDPSSSVSGAASGGDPFKSCGFENSMGIDSDDDSGDDSGGASGIS